MRQHLIAKSTLSGVAFIGFAALVLCGQGASAAPIDASILLDGSLFSAVPSAVVTYDPTAPNGNFQAPTSASAYIGYNIYLRSDGTNYYGLFVASPTSGAAVVGPFANIYLDLDPQNLGGSDLGFELGANSADAFIPGVAGKVLTPDVSTAANSLAFGFAIPIADLINPIVGLTYNAGQAFPDAANPDVTLRLSQTFGFSVAWGPSYGPDRLGTVALASSAVPEPATWAMFGVGLVGLGIIRRRKLS
jgi:hypothetical protein